MLTGPVIVAVSLVYLLLLFVVAYIGDKRADEGRSIIDSSTIYALSLAVYCTTWTYYGSVGRAASSGLGFVPIFLGPTLAMAVWWFVMLKMLRIAKTLRITSIADFIASRYGKSHLLGGLVTVIAVLGVLPYIALQLKAVSNSFIILSSYPDIVMPERAGVGAWFADTALYVALLMAAFTIVFGTRHLDATERHEGMVAAVAFESLVKLVMFLAVGAYVTYGLFDGFEDVFARAAQIDGLRSLMTMGVAARGYGGWFAMTFLSMLALTFLPRQFQVAVVENVNESHLRRAVWLFPLYMLLINLFVLPIALGGLMIFAGRGVDADTFVLTLPMVQGQQGLALLAFIGGLSAATGMVIVETIALSTMVCNDLVMPLLLRFRRIPLLDRDDLTGLLLGIRRGAIVLILLLGYLYFRLAGEAQALVSIGLISFAAVAQFAPAMFGGMYWRDATRPGALAGLSGGFLMWLYTLLLPAFAKSGWLPAGFLHDGLFGVTALRPQALFGLTEMDPIAHSLFWSLLVNIGAYLGVSLWRRPNAVEAGQATLFVDIFKQTRPAGGDLWRGSARVTDLFPVVARFLGRERARQAFDGYARQRGLNSMEALEADAGLVHFAETTLAGAIGAASARVMVSTVVKEEPLGLDEVLDILDEASQVRAYSHQLEQKSRELEAATRDLRSANERLKELDRLKDDFMSSVTHELRTPLTSIRAFSEMLLDDPEIGVEERTRFLGIIVSESERLTRLVNQVLDMAKIESGHAEWQTGEVDLSQVINQAVASTSQIFKDKDVALTVNVPAQVPLLLADRDRLVQVVLNLLSNAVKFVARGSGLVSISLVESDEGLRVDVRDNGPGLTPEEQAMVFEKFRQGGDTMTSKPQGTGLGLPISRQIIEHYGGRLWVESQPGEGASFSFLLPCGKSAETNNDAG